MNVLTDLKNRGVQDLFITCVDGLTGFPEAIAAVFPQALVQLCMVHLVRNSVVFVSYKDRKAVCADLKAIYTATTEDEAELNLELFAEKWDAQYPSIPCGKQAIAKVGRTTGSTSSRCSVFHLRSAG
jgi:putative transposase